MVLGAHQVAHGGEGVLQDPVSPHSHLHRQRVEESVALILSVMPPRIPPVRLTAKVLGERGGRKEGARGHTRLDHRPSLHDVLRPGVDPARLHAHPSAPPVLNDHLSENLDPLVERPGVGRERKELPSPLGPVLLRLLAGVGDCARGGGDGER